MSGKIKHMDFSIEKRTNHSKIKIYGDESKIKKYYKEKDLNIFFKGSYLPMNMFHKKEELLEVVVPDNIEDLNDFDFEECTSMLRIVFSDSIKLLPHRILVGCKSLQEIYFGKNIININSTLFDNCDALEKISVSNENKKYRSKEGVLYDHTFSVLIKYPKGKIDENFNMLLDTKIINDFAFSNSKIKNITFEEKVEKINEFSFWSCKNLEKIILPNSLKFIGARAFMECSLLEEVILPDEIKYIGIYPFLHCNKLNKIIWKNKEYIKEEIEFLWHDKKIKKEVFKTLEELLRKESILDKDDCLGFPYVLL